MRCFVLLLAALLLSTPVGAADASSPKSTTTPITAQSNAPCGSTVSEALTRTRQTFASTDAASQRLALACLTEAVSAMNDKIALLDQAFQERGAPRVKFFTEPVKVLGQ